MKMETLSIVLIYLILLAAAIAFVLYWIRKTFKQNNKESIIKLCDEYRETIWPRITGEKTKEFIVYAKERLNPFQPEGTGEMVLVGYDLQEELLKWVALKERQYPFLSLHPIALLSVKTLHKSKEP